MKPEYMPIILHKSEIIKYNLFQQIWIVSLFSVIKGENMAVHSEQTLCGVSWGFKSFRMI